MKKKVMHFVRCAFVNMLLLSAVSPLRAQVSNPSSWERFVGSDENRLVSDTFRLQTFGISEWDNWDYTLTGSSYLPPEKYLIKMPLGSGVVFQPFSLTCYTNVKIIPHVAGLNLRPKDTLLFHLHRNNADEVITAYIPSPGKDYMRYTYFAIMNNASSFAITTNENIHHQDGFYMMDTLFAYGDIPSYSLFSGTGDWNDTARWSHLPPLRHRNALIKGEVTITEDTHCQDIAIHSGSLKIDPESRLVLQNLDLYENGAALYSEGAMPLSGRITLHKTFEEAGKWYFISFPFDVYPSGIDPRFEQKDDIPNEGGDYFYVQSYNGDKRASANLSAGNWEVLPICPENRPLFEKGNGYLIAFDEEATDLTLSFSSRPGDIPEDFAHTGAIDISFASPMSPDGNKENYGWYLCGNPFPAPLVLSQIEGNTDLDGNLYVYDGNGYTSYPLNSDYALPPFAVFFVKASFPTELRISANPAPAKRTKTIPTDYPVSKSPLEPCQESLSAGTGSRGSEEPLFFIKERHLHLLNIPEAGSIRILNLAGHCLLQKEIRQGAQVIPLAPIPPGIYILQIHSAHYQRHCKVAVSFP